MSLPVSQYEALLAEVRGLRRKAQRVQQLAKPLLQGEFSTFGTYIDNSLQHDVSSEPLDYTMESLLQNRQDRTRENTNFDRGTSSAEGDTTCSEDEYCNVRKSSTKMSVSSEPVSNKRNMPSSLYHGTWPVEKNMWNSEPARLGHDRNSQKTRDTIMEHQIEVNSVVSFASSSGGVPFDRMLGSPERNKWSSQNLDAKIDVVHSLLSMLGNQDHIDMGETLLALSTCPESCLAMRQSGCIPLLVQLVQSDRDSGTRKKAAQALHNLVNLQSDEKLRKRESRVLKLLENCRVYTEAIRYNLEYEPPESSMSSEDGDLHPVQTVAHLMKLSFDEGHRQAICLLGGIHTIASLVEVEHSKHGGAAVDSHCILMRRYACMALTNLTFGDSGNKALLCSYRDFMRALVIHLQSPSDELRQVTASVLRNLSWRADSSSKEILREVGSVTGLMKAAMLDNKENTLKSILSALWNLSAHCTENKSEICAVEGALGFLVDMLMYKTPTKSLAIVENSGGILRNISSQIAVREDYREVLRKHNCLQILLDQLKSPSLTIVSNACGTLWNLSAKSPIDQEILWRLGAPTMLRSLNHSKHKMIAMGSSAALKNLLSARPQQLIPQQLDSTALALDLPKLPTLGARKQKALMQDLDQNLSETYDNIERDSPVKKSGKDSSIPDFVPDSRLKSTSGSSLYDYAQERLANNFASLNLNDPSTSYMTDFRSKPRIIQNYGSSSLPYMPPPIKRSNPCTYIPVRNKFSDCGYDDEIDVSDQPIDYSRKYSETKIVNNQASNGSIKKESDYSYEQQDNKENFGMYAETDLDQPTDYSLRYAEDDSDSDICGKIDKNEPQEYLQDTVKTYCTEDTPYETPFNFSNATSMSDLRVDEKQIIDNDKIKENMSHSKKEKHENIEEKERCSTEDISEIENKKKIIDDKIPKSELSSGLMSPEKPVNYCEEGTPGYFSRVSSFGSLNSLPANETLKDLKDNDCLEKSNDNLVQETDKSLPKMAETKAVKFEKVVNYAEQTPLMFSRSSSLASLDSIEQHSIHDDRSSVVSDLSRLTSGIVSPSELPDSPTQTVPPSPKPRKTSMEFPSTSKSRSFEGRSQSVRTLHKPSVFEDNVTKFKEENTPVQFSTATSLSSLTIDDHEDAGGEMTELEEPGAKETTLDTIEAEGVEKKDAEKESSSSDINDIFNGDSEDGDEDDILAACINMGMQSNRASRVQSPLSTIPSVPQSKLTIANYKYSPKSSLASGIPLPRHNSPKSTLVHSVTRQTSKEVDIRSFSKEENVSILSRTNPNISFEGPDRKGDYSSDDSSNLSGDNDNILAQCIQSGMPKAKQEPSKTIVKVPSASCLPRRNNFQTDDQHPNNQQSLPLNKYVLTSSASNSRKEANKTNVDSEKRAGRREQSLPPYLSAGDELENYAVENSPCHFSLRSSLSDLTVDGSVAGLKKSSTVSNDQQNIEPEDAEADAALKNNQEIQRQRDDRESLSSISVESLGSIEAEQALLEQCISSGKPKSNSVSPTTNLEFSRSSLRRSMGKQQSRDRHGVDVDSHKSKNVNAASVAGNTTFQTNEVRPDKITIPAAGVESIPDPDIGTMKIEGRDLTRRATMGRIKIPIENQPENPTDMLQDRSSPIEEISSKDAMKNGFNDSFPKLEVECFENLAIEDRLARSCEDSKLVDNRMLDPDAMIESLDRFTAELVSQASHLNRDDDRYKISTTDSTWNEDSSPNEVTFPSLSGSVPNVITFSNEDDSSKVEDEVDALKEPEPSIDFSSINTSTMTDSTLIAIEASKMATVFKNEAEMSISMTSAVSLELDHVQPPSNLNSLTNSAVGLPKSPKLVARKKSLTGLMVRKALSNSLNHGSSLESLENQSLLDNINPPSDLLLDMENSITSIESFGNENNVRTDFHINGIVNKQLSHTQHPIFNVKQPFNSSTYGGGCNEIENINPPSLFNEITDFCNSLADVNTDIICSDMCEDDTVTAGDVTLGETTVCISQDDITECSFTSLNSNPSSVESTPKKQKSLSKSMMTKQRRILARERFKTYTIAAEMVLRDSLPKDSVEVAEDTHRTESNDIETTPEQQKKVGGKSLTPKERRQLNRSRFETQVLDESVISSSLQQPLTPPPTPPCTTYMEQQGFNTDSCNSSPTQSPSRTKLSIRRNFLQKRLENKERFRTQTLSESSFSPSASVDSPPLSAEIDIQIQLQKEADLVLKTIRATKTHEELLDCETLSLVSNDDDSEHNSASSVNYRTYHKSWGVSQNNIPIIASVSVVNKTENLVNDLSSQELHQEVHDSLSDDDSSEEHRQIVAKPKIIKPSEYPTELPEIQESPKAVRGRRKPLYSKSNFTSKMAPKNIRPVKNVTSNLVTNVTSNFKPATVLKPKTNLPTKRVLSKAPLAQANQSKSVPQNVSTKTSPSRAMSAKGSPKHTAAVQGKTTKNPPKEPPALERQGTFTKDESNSSGEKKATRIPTLTPTRIPTFTSKVTMRNAKNPSNGEPIVASKPPTARNSYTKSASVDKTNKISRIYNRSTSADSRDTSKLLQPSHSSHSLKSDTKVQYGAVKKSAIPGLAQRSNSNSSITSNGSTNAKKQVTSKIATLWKKIEDTKKQPPKKDARKWIQPISKEEPQGLILSNTFENEDETINRDQALQNGDSTKRISRWGSFVIVDGEDPDNSQQSGSKPMSVRNVM